MIGHAGFHTFPICVLVTRIKIKVHFAIGAKSGYHTFIKTGILPSYAIMATRRKSHQEKVIQSMQTLTTQHPNSINQQTRKIAIIALLLFALSGLISGFAVGAFTHAKFRASGTTSVNVGSTPVTQKTRPPVATTGTEKVSLGYPMIDNYSFLQVANGSSSYTVSALIANKIQNPGQVTDVTCKLWLTQNGDINSILGANNYAIPRAIDKVLQPIPGEVMGALNYLTPSQQVQPCTLNGKTSWHYTISPSTNPGTYYLVVLADWKGKNFKWFWVNIKIKKSAQ
jgi:hypothetical protein